MGQLENTDGAAEPKGSKIGGEAIPIEWQQTLSTEALKIQSAHNDDAQTQSKRRAPLDVAEATGLSWGVPAGTELALWELTRRNPTSPYLGGVVNDKWADALNHAFRAHHNQEVVDRMARAKAKPGTPECYRLQARLNTYEALQLGKPKDAIGHLYADRELFYFQSGSSTFFHHSADLELAMRIDMGLNSKKPYGFTELEARRLDQLRGHEASFLAVQAAKNPPLFSQAAGIRLARGIAGSTAMYALDTTTSASLAKTNPEVARYLSASAVEIATVGATMVAPVPKFVPGANGPWYAKVGARALYEAGAIVSSKTLAYGFDKIHDPEKQALEVAVQALTNDRKTQTSASMDDAITAWRAVGQDQLEQKIKEFSNASDPDSNLRDLAILWAALGESRLAEGTRVSGAAPDGSPSGDTSTSKLIFGDTNYDFGGTALRSLNNARNALNDLDILPYDDVARRVYSGLSQSDMGKIMNPHGDVAATFIQLTELVNENDPKAQTLTAWMQKRVNEERATFLSDQEEAHSAKLQGLQRAPKYENYVYAKVLQDQALLDLAYVASGQDVPLHLQSAHDRLKEAKDLGWDGREIRVNNLSQKRQSDLPNIIEIYENLGGDRSLR